jgi:hypothetical protein
MLNRQTLSRRQFHLQTGLGAGSIALNAMLHQQANASEQFQPHHSPTATNVIFLFMSGGPSQVDTFDPKPELDRLAGNDVPESIARNVPKIQRAGLRNLMASPWKFHNSGESGLPISELFTQTANHADSICLIRSMSHRNPVHGPGECVALTGTGTGDRPSLGSWTLYGLGRQAEQLPAFITMNVHTDGMQFPQAAGWGSSFLPAHCQGTVVDPIQGIQNLTMPQGVDTNRRQHEIQAIQQLNRNFLDSVKHNSELEARIRSYELAFRMQTTAPELFDLARESDTTHQMYGLESKQTQTVGRACLLARRMVERGVRFVQLRVGGWDAHGKLKDNHEKMAARTDRPIAALLKDLKRTGLLDSTLVVWGGEFGRTPTMEGRANGRDHSPAAYTVWLAGGGIAGGQIIGETDAIGYAVQDRPVKPQDLHATILHALGINSRQLLFDHHGLQESPLGVSGGSALVDLFGTMG